jgi:hypothetical protein
MFDAAPARWRLATGVPAEVRELVERFGVSILPAAKDGQIPHTQEAVIVDARGRFADSLAGDDWSPADLVARARSVAGRPTNPFEQVRIALTRGIEAACGGGKSGVTLGAGILIFLGLLAASATCWRVRCYRRVRRLPSHSKIVAKPIDRPRSQRNRRASCSSRRCLFPKVAAHATKQIGVRALQYAFGTGARLRVRPRRAG